MKERTIRGIVMVLTLITLAVAELSSLSHTPFWLDDENIGGDVIRRRVLVRPLSIKVGANNFSLVNINKDDPINIKKAAYNFGITTSSNDLGLQWYGICYKRTIENAYYNMMRAFVVFYPIKAPSPQFAALGVDTKESGFLGLGGGKSSGVTVNNNTDFCNEIIVLPVDKTGTSCYLAHTPNDKQDNIYYMVAGPSGTSFTERKQDATVFTLSLGNQIEFDLINNFHTY